MSKEGMLHPEGHWIPAIDSPHRALTAEEVAEAQAMAERVDFQENDPSECDCATRAEGRCGYHQDPRRHALWEDHHPVVRAVWEKRGIKPRLKASRRRAG